MSPDTAAASWSKQSEMLWSRLQTVSAIEAGTIAAIYQLWKDDQKVFLVVTLIFASCLIFLISLLMVRDGAYLEAFRDKAGIDRPKGFLRGRVIGYVMMFSLIVVNLLLVLGVFMSGCFSN